MGLVRVNKDSSNEFYAVWWITKVSITVPSGLANMLGEGIHITSMPQVSSIVNANNRNLRILFILYYKSFY